MKRLLDVSLQKKILGLVTFLLILVLGLITTLITYMDTNEEVENAENLAQQTATTLSYLPVVQDKLSGASPETNLNVIAERFREEVDASGIKIINRDGELLGYAGNNDSLSIDTSNYYKALVFGSTYLTHPGTGADTVLQAITPIKVDYESHMKIEGAVAVEFRMQTIQQDIRADIRRITYIALSVLVIGFIGSMLLSRSIRKDTLGLEPSEIAALFRERNAVLDSVKEGLIAFDQGHKVTMLNASARDLLDIKGDTEAETLEDVIASPKMRKLVYSREGIRNRELEYKDKTLIINSSPIFEDTIRTGTVVSLRDKTEIKKMVDALSEVQQYSEDLRAQAHEYTSKLYVLLGLIQLGKYDEAVDLIQEEAKTQRQVSDLFFKDILDEKVQAILLGKLAKASEKKITFTIEDGSSLQQLPEQISLSPLVVVLGNVINNAFEAVTDQDEKEVTLSVTDFGNDIIFEITDNGPGMDQSEIDRMFNRGTSSKGKHRGYGLANAQEELEEMKGFMEVMSYPGEGTTFTIIIPKNEPL
ncbi:ATP-binding protein [Salimicrobium halophilum]|uniref:histidine kinase n=1 Tax=Salimicrobium halophilum TaxID=86666 RepID=A0A1G8SD91_9BACI|nr:sensor histidine kinase [Salimicrobium halophilum]SDJ27229.1 two-component system, CitB family, sensor histidine kinase CitS [Salimicrobium halophilum]